MITWVIILQVYGVQMARQRELIKSLQVLIKKLMSFFWSYPEYPEYKIAGANIGNEFYFIGGEQGGDTVYTNLYKTDGTVSGNKGLFSDV